VAVIDAATLRLEDRISLGGPAVVTVLRRGERRFYDGSATFQGQFSCRSCHPDGGMDGLTWDFEIDGLGKEVVDSMSLAGIRDTAPFKWRGKNPTLARQCGPRLSRVLIRTDPFPPDQLADLVAYIASIPPRRPRPSPETAEAEARGKALFLRTRTNRAAAIPKKDRCDTCHTPPLYTIRLPFDVGTGGRFDTPYLGGIRYTAPYLHDDRALSLEEIWTVHNSSDTHGISSDMNKAQLNDLVTFLRSL
jgi:cytochrome c peroxidase